MRLWSICEGEPQGPRLAASPDAPDTDVAEVAEAKRFLGDRFGDLVFVATGVPRPRCPDEASRHAKWEEQARVYAAEQ
jgi:hypothetical protein